MLRFLSASLLDKTPIKEFFTKKPGYVADDGQLTFNYILWTLLIFLNLYIVVVYSFAL